MLTRRAPREFLAHLDSGPIGRRVAGMGRRGDRERKEDAVVRDGRRVWSDEVERMVQGWLRARSGSPGASTTLSPTERLDFQVHTRCPLSREQTPISGGFLSHRFFQKARLSIDPADVPASGVSLIIALENSRHLFLGMYVLQKTLSATSRRGPTTWLDGLFGSSSNRLFQARELPLIQRQQMVEGQVLQDCRECTGSPHTCIGLLQIELYRT
jgi:hypothetical protein